MVMRRIHWRGTLNSRGGRTSRSALLEVVRVVCIFTFLEIPLSSLSFDLCCHLLVPCTLVVYLTSCSLSCNRVLVPNVYHIVYRFEAYRLSPRMAYYDESMTQNHICDYNTTVL